MTDAPRAAPPPNQEIAEIADARRRFDAACEQLRPDLHRFCTRMTGNPCDGEDVLHDTLALAFYRLSELRDTRALRGWLFRIAHNKCIDHLRARRRGHALGLDDEPTSEDPLIDDHLDRKQRTERVLANIVTELPPRERACIVLKDVLEFSLEDTADVVGSSVGAVKAALHRGRDKLERADLTPPRAPTSLPAGQRALVERYLAAFNRRDWDAVLALLSDDARLEVVHRSEGPLRDSSYFTNYGHLAWPWKLALAHVDGIESVVHFRHIDGAWAPHTVVQLSFDGAQIAVVRDYIHVDYLLRNSTID